MALVKEAIAHRLKAAQGLRQRKDKGEKLWKDAERRKITSHSWSSMQNRYRKQIFPNWDHYYQGYQEFLRRQAQESTPVATDSSKKDEKDAADAARATRMGMEMIEDMGTEKTADGADDDWLLLAPKLSTFESVFRP